MTTVQQARRVAADWAAATFGDDAAFRGAFLTGSVISSAPDDELAASSDVDVTVLLDGSAAKIGKFRHDGVLIEATPMPFAELADPDVVERTHYLAPSFTGGQVLADPNGRLAELESRIAPRFAEPSRVRARCADVETRLRRQLDGLDLDRSWAQLVTGVVFPASLTTVWLAVAAGRNPTVRKRYLQCRDALAGTPVAGVYDDLLRLAGCEDVTAATVRHHLDVLGEMFDVAAATARTAFFFSADVTPDARSVAIDGSRELVDSGNHREAVYWVVATFARCQQILDADAPPAVTDAWRERFRAATGELVGLSDLTDLQRRKGDILAALPSVGDAAEQLISNRPGG